MRMTILDVWLTLKQHKELDALEQMSIMRSYCATLNIDEMWEDANLLLAAYIILGVAREVAAKREN